MQEINQNKKPLRFREVISLFTRLILGLLFLYASLDKIIYPYSFYRNLQEYEILPSSLEPLFSILIPWTEFFAGLFLLLGMFYRSSGLLILILLIAFEYGIVINLLRGKEMDCHCFNLNFLGIKDTLSWQTAIRDLVFILMALEVTFFSKPRFALDRIVLFLRRF